ncbi:hypothetical protein [Neobacillus drentensis]|uniref:hypothetical protein n=1 Tax=Neobacillus drentensis TaxID=220684 RepID=UPI0012FAB86F|nr:hypothetical protein [Neobacillus drentensis]
MSTEKKSYNEVNSYWIFSYKWIWQVMKHLVITRGEKVLENQKNDAKIQWLTKPKVVWRFASSMFNKRDIFN